MPLTCGLNAIQRVRQQRRAHDQKNNRQRGKENIERDFIWRFLAFGPLDQRNHPVEKCLAGVCRDANDEPVRQHARSAGDAAPIAAAFADDGRTFASDSAFIDRGPLRRELRRRPGSSDWLSRGHDPFA